MTGEERRRGGRGKSVEGMKDEGGRGADDGRHLKHVNGRQK